MVSERLHPSVREQVGTFESFVPFVGVSDEDQKTAFIRVLRRLYDETSGIWFPGACGSASHLVRAGRELYLPGVVFEPVRHSIYHFFALLDIDSVQVKGLIVDPFGIPEAGADLRTNPRLITPYFGELALAPTESHSRVYSDTKPGHRTFVP